MAERNKKSSGVAGFGGGKLSMITSPMINKAAE
jgi:hypothetical protein